MKGIEDRNVRGYSLLVHPIGAITFSLVVTSFFIFQLGFSQDIDENYFGNDESTWANNDVCDDPRFAGEGVSAFLSVLDLARDQTDCFRLYQEGQVFVWSEEGMSGTLALGDSISAGSTYSDIYEFEVNEKTELVFELRSLDFDTLLRIRHRDGDQIAENDDYRGDINLSYVELELDVGNYEIEVTSFVPKETGNYTLIARQVMPLEVSLVSQ